MVASVVVVVVFCFFLREKRGAGQASEREPNLLLIVKTETEKIGFSKQFVSSAFFRGQQRTADLLLPFVVRAENGN